MSREDPNLTRYTSFPAVAEGQRTTAVLNSMGMRVAVDFFTQLALSGFTYHVQVGTENAGATLTGAIDDQLAAVLADNNAGNAIIPLFYHVDPGVLAGATVAQAMLELDKEKNRYSSGGTAFTPENLNGLDLNSFNGSAYVCGASDIVAAAKTAVPDSVELARRTFIEDALADSIGYPGAWDLDIYDVRKNPVAVGVDTCSLVGHAGSATADLTGYVVLQFAQLPKSSISG